MRVLGALLMTLGLPALAAAQQTTHDPRALPTLPTIGLPLPTIGLPLTPLGLPPAGAPARDPTPPPRGDNGPGHAPGRRGSHTRPSVVYTVYPYGWPVYEPAPLPEAPATAPAPAPASEPRAGSVRLELAHLDGAAQVFVDDYFVGTIDDLGVELRMVPGPHSVEVRADGFETLAVNVSITADRSITYRAALQPLAGTVLQPPAPAAPSTLYLIPGCYLGNVPPDQVKLPANCDLSRLITRKP
jgi:hypothetical protein